MKGAAIINLFPMFIRPYVRFLSLPPFVHNIIIIVYIGLWDVRSQMFVHKLNELLSISLLLFKTAEDISKNTEVTWKINQYVSLPRDLSLHSEQGAFSLTGLLIWLMDKRPNGVENSVWNLTRRILATNVASIYTIKFPLKNGILNTITCAT